MHAHSHIYLDHNATTPVDPRVLEAMLPYFQDQFGNAASVHHPWGWDAAEAVAQARAQVAALIGARPAEIIFTSGATEAIHLGLMGAARAYRHRGHHILTCATEHRAVLDTCAALAADGFQVTYLPVAPSGQLSLDRLAQAVTPETSLVCLMHANNETGLLHPLAEFSAWLRARDILLMTDATQSLGKVPVDVDALGVDLATFSAHKLYGPKGIGALYLRRQPRVQLDTGLPGGGQERGLRPGTLNVPGIVGFGQACALAAQELATEGPRLAALRDAFEAALVHAYGAQVNGQGDRLPHTTNLTFPGLDGEALLRAMPELGLSQGAACSSATVQPSHVLTAMGRTEAEALASLRIGLGRGTTAADMDVALACFHRALAHLSSQDHARI